MAKIDGNGGSHEDSLKEKIHEIIFEADTPLGKLFDVVLLVLIAVSVLAVMLESVESIDLRFHRVFFVTEWVLTALFTIEYFLRVYCVRNPRHYITSFFGVVDLLAILPTYLSLFLANSHYLLVVRALRLLRIARIFKLVRFVREAQVIITALKASRVKITVFLGVVLTLSTIIGSVMYLVEANANSGFTSIPASIYWAIVTLTTVGYGDIAPATPLGQFLAAVVMIMGYGIIAVPTGIVTVELNRAVTSVTTRSCHSCSAEGHDADARFCKYCGEEL